MSNLVDDATLSELSHEFNETHAGGGLRHVLGSPVVRRTLQSRTLVAQVTARLSNSAFAFKATMFDKHNAANWLVGWHRDLSIPVDRKMTLPGWTRWSVKAGVNYVNPPFEMMARILAIRINLDASSIDNGPLRVLPGSHRGDSRTTAIGEQGLPLLGAAGDAWLMRPTVLHASSKAKTSKRRRVLHLEFADFELPGDLGWDCRIRVA